MPLLFEVVKICLSLLKIVLKQKCPKLNKAIDTEATLGH